MSYFNSPAQEFVFTRSYARWLPDQKRRENLEEAVDRYLRYLDHRTDGKVPAKVFMKARRYFLNLEVVGSMRSFWAAGPASDSTDVANFNCAYQNIDCIEAFSECLYILMCGTGYGFSVEKKHVSKLPKVPTISGTQEHVVEDSKDGWARSLDIQVRGLYSGVDTTFDYSCVRDRGARLNTFGGRASGPDPLKQLHDFVRQTFLGAQGRQLKTIECLDVLNVTAVIVVVGGVRRSSEICLSDLADEDLRDAKSWPFPDHRAMSNNSTVHHGQPGAVELMSEFAALGASGTGERGIINMDGMRRRAPRRRDANLLEGVNPCAEIVLRNKQFCNLSEVIVRPEDDLDSLLEKVECATWLGAIQSTLTNFPFLSPEWKANCDEERLLGVSLSGQRDNPTMINPHTLQCLKSRVLKVAKKASVILEVNFTAAATCVKPSGTVGQFVDCAAGLHARHSRYLVRRFRIADTDPLYKMLKAQGVQMTPENGQQEPNVDTWVVSFPMESPAESVTRDQLTALEQLEHYKMLQEHWCEHNASCTIYVRDDEWFEVGNWVYQNWKHVSGVSFFPYDSGHYKQAPFEEITEKQFLEMKRSFPDIDYTKLREFEEQDSTTGNQELGCAGGLCEL